MPSDGPWISCAQYWPGGGSSVYACWYDQVYQRVAPDDSLRHPVRTALPTFTPATVAERNTIGGSWPPAVGRGYGVDAADLAGRRSRITRWSTDVQAREHRARPPRRCGTPTPIPTRA